MNRHCDIVGMANFAPILNTRGCIYTHAQGIVLRSTYHVFDLYVNYLGDVVLDSWGEDMPVMSVLDKKGQEAAIDTLDVPATRWTDQPGWALAIVNKDPEKAHDVSICMPEADGDAVMYSICGLGKDSYNDIDRNEVFIERNIIGRYRDGMTLSIAPHSVNVLHIGVTEVI